MPDVYEYFHGICTICGSEDDVRYKNIFLIGSEGIDICWTCEKDLLEYLDERRRSFTFKKLKRLKERIKRKFNIKKDT